MISPSGQPHISFILVRRPTHQYPPSLSRSLAPSLPSSITSLIFVTRFQLVPEVLRGNRSLHIHHQSSPRSSCSVHEHRYSFSYFFNTNNNKKTNKILGLSVYVINKQSTAATFSLSQSGQYSFGPGSYFISILL